MSHVPLNRRLVAVFVGTGALLATVVGSGMMGENLADGTDALPLLGNTLAKQFAATHGLPYLWHANPRS